MKRRVYIFALVVLLLLFASSVQAITRYVRNGSGNGCSNGNINYNVTSDSCGIGGSAQIYTSIATGIAVTQAGDTLNIRAGTYAEVLDGNNLPALAGSAPSGWKTSAWNPAGATFIQAYCPSGNCDQVNGQYGPASGAEVVTLNGRLLFNRSNMTYVVVKNLRVVYSSGGDAICVCSGNSSLVNLNHFKFDGLDISGTNNDHPTTSAAMTFGDAFGGAQGADSWVTHTAIHDSAATNVASHNSIHGIYNDADRLLVEYSTFYNWHVGSGIQQYTGTNETSEDSIYRNNYFHHIGSTDPALLGGSALTIWQGVNTVAYNNIFYLTDEGVSIKFCSNCLVYSNTFYDTGNNPHDNCCSPVIQGDAAYGIARNNIVSNAVVPTVNVLTASNNLCSSAGTGCAFVEASSATTFISPGTDFHLKTGSLAIDGGTANITIGTSIPACSGGITTGCYNGTAPDIGALETGVPTSGGGPPVLTANPSTVTVGAAMSVTVDDDDVKERVEDVGDWVGVFAPGAAVPPGGAIDNISLFDWFWMNGSKSAPSVPISDAVINFTAPSTVGTYEFRFYQNGSNFEVDRLATAPFTVIAPGIVMKFVVSAIKIGPSVTWKIGTP